MTAPRGESVLAKLTAQVMSEKKTAAQKLTPVAGEVRPTLTQQTIPASFPNDMPLEVAAEKARELTRIIVHLTESRDALLAVAEKTAHAEVVDIEAARKAKEKEADERAANFNADFEAKQAEAKAAVFGADPVAASDSSTDVGAASTDGELPSEAGIGGWVCPEHGLAVDKVSVKGRSFVGCPNCNQFQR